MNKYLTLIILSFFCLADRACGYEIVILKSSANKINQHFQEIFTDELNQRTPPRGLKSIQPNQIKDILITKEDKADYTSAIQSIHPDLILALGVQALEVALSIPDIPVVHLLVIHPETIIDKRKPVTGVSLSVSPKMQLEEMSRYFPKVKRIGLVYDPTQSRKFIEQLDAVRPDLEFIALPTENIAQVPELIHSLQGKIDLLWMLPDLTTTNQMTIQNYVLFSIRNKVPLLTFSEKLLKHGATIAVTFDTDEMVKLAAALAMDMLSHPLGGRQAALAPPPVQTIVNYNMAAKLGIPIADRGGTDE